jgi:putative Holliday junction resolvase
MTLDSSGARVIAVDVGTKRVGLAKADPLCLFAQAHGTFAPDDALDELARLHDGDGIETLVVGWPLTEAGEAGEATEQVDAYIERIRERLGDVPIARRDERFTSEMAKDALRRAGVKQPGRYDKGRVDAAAAALILQDYLDTQG